MIRIRTVACVPMTLPYGSGFGRVVCILVVLALSCFTADLDGRSHAQNSSEKTWELPGRISIYDLQFGPAVLKDAKWTFLGNTRTFNADGYGSRLTFMVRFAYKSSRSDIPLKFVIKLPDSRQYEKTVNLNSRNGQYAYKFTIHRPEDFLGSGSIYLYYGFSIVDVLDFTIVPGA